MPNVDDIINNWRAFDPAVAALEAFDDTHEIWADMNASQMYEGINAKDEPITLDGTQGYAFSTVQRKERKGQPTDRVTLRDKGDLYAGLFAELTGNVIFTSTTVDYADDLEERTGKDIFGLNEGNIKEFAIGPYLVSFLSFSKQLLKLE